MSEFYIICRPSGRFGNAIFRYLAAVKLMLKYKNLKYLPNENNIKSYNIVNEQNIFDYLNNDFKINNNLLLEGYFQFDIYLDDKKDIIDFIEKHKNEHQITSSSSHGIKLFYMMNQIIDDIILNKSKIYDIVIHIRLGDFNSDLNRIDYEYLEKLFEKIDFSNKKVAILSEPLYFDIDKIYLQNMINWFNKNNIEINIETNDLITDFNIMKQTKELICCMSTFDWTAAYFSKNLEKCYMPNYNFDLKIINQTFKHPIKNVIFYDVKSTVK
jgi:hypothetical protein